MPNGASSPVQGRHQQHEPRQLRPALDCHKPPLQPPSSSSPPASTTGSTRRNLNATDSGSPTVANPQSPLRQSVSYDDDDDDGGDLPTPPSFKGVIDFANSKIGRATMSFTGDRRGRGRRSGASELHQDGVTTTSETPTPKNLSPAAGGATGGSSRFASFASSMFKGVASTSSSPVSVPQDDDLMNIDIESALFPAGSDGEAFSPAAFKNLQQTASGLLNRFQSAYQQRTIAYHELKAERGAQADEKEEAETRMQHLKLQLEDMARKAAEQESTMQSLMDELAQEKKARSEERQAREKGSSLSEGSSVSEDLGVEEDQRRRRKWRRSGETAKSDLGFDTDEESVEEASVFSRSRSPTIATSMTEISSVEPPVPQIKTPVIVAPRAPKLPPPPTSHQQQPQMNTFQKLFKGISGDAPKETDSKGQSSCRNCEGQDASIAWDTVNLLKDENKGLKTRVGELETAVDGALDAVYGISL